MKIARSFGTIAAFAALVAATLVYRATPARGLALQNSPAQVTRPGADITDVYLFPSPTNSTNVVAVMDVYPSIPAGAAAFNTYFDQNVLYTMKFDRRYGSEAAGTGPTPDYVMQFSVGAVSGNTQQVLFYGPAAPNETSSTTTLVNSGTATASGAINTSFNGGNGITIFAGVRADPFFFDLNQYYKIFPDRQRGSTATSCLPGFGNGSCPTGFNALGTDYFANSNVLSIVVELPKALLTPASGSLGTVAYWATTSTTSGQ